MKIQEAIQQYRDIGQNSDPEFDPVIRRESWEHGRILIPTQEDFYARIVGKFPVLPMHITLLPDDVMADDWTVTTLAKMIAPETKKEPKRTGRRKTVEA